MPYGPLTRKKIMPDGMKYTLWHRQSPPYRTPLAFYMQEQHCSSTFNMGWPQASHEEGEFIGKVADVQSFVQGNIVPPGAEELSVKCFERIKARAQKTASLSTTLAEAKSAISMVSGRALQLLKAARSLKRGDLRGFSKALDLNPNRVRGHLQGRGRKDTWRQDLSGTWLEFTFGWAPLVSDIGACVEVLQQDFPTSRIRGRATHQFTREREPVYEFWNERESLHLETRCQYSCDVRVVNPNLALANQLGFVNPLSVAWELVPFSFVVDWFIPVGAFLESYSAFAGLSLENCAVTTMRKCSGHASSVHKFSPGSYWRITDTSMVEVVRSPVGSFPIPSLLSRVQLPGPSAWLAATSLSLAVQQISALRTK